uniref:Reverse transcriptase domain-containing protein n=1 Tax=Parastrongyloides trichosuri TaxID=131310 RepID=A0A0N4ZA88_PARTI
MQPMGYKRLPMGFVNSPAILRQLLESRIPPTVIRFYYDDGLKGTVGDIEQHLKNMEEIFRHLYKASLKINLSKSILCSDNIEVLGGQIKI